MQIYKIIFLALFLTSCANIQSATPICEGFGFIYPSRADTTETKRQVLTHNQTFKKLCSPKNAENGEQTP